MNDRTPAVKNDSAAEKNKSDSATAGDGDENLHPNILLGNWKGGITVKALS